MSKLSVRLRSVAALVDSGGVLADVGCDHGYLPIWLIETGRISRAIAMDVNPGPLAHAAEHIREAGLEAYIETRLSDGLRELSRGEADSLVIAGMGGALTIRILSDSCHIWQNLREVILQPQSEIEAVRRYIYASRFRIVREDMVEEDGKYYMMMRCVPAAEAPVVPEGGMAAADLAASGEKEADRASAGAEMTEVYYRYGRCLVQQRHPVLLGYLRKSEMQLRGILENLRRQEPTEPIWRRIGEVEEKLAVLSAALSEMEEPGTAACSGMEAPGTAAHSGRKAPGTAAKEIKV